MIFDKLGRYIKLSEVRNIDKQYTADNVVGISTQKLFINTLADLSDVSLTSYKLVPPRHFAFVADTSRRGDKISLAFNTTNDTYLVSSISTVFYVKDTAKLLPEYLFMYFNRAEFDRYTRFNSWGSAREVFTWEEMCDIDIELPDIQTQQKYVDVYNAMVENQKAYETGLDDLKLTCDAYIEELRRKMPCEKIEQYISRIDIRNGANGSKNVKGISVYKTFREPTSKVNREELKNYKVVQPQQISFVQTTHNEKVFAYALNNTNENIVVSSINEVFSCNKEKLLPEYLALFFNRSEFDRYVRYHSWGSARETFTWSDLVQVSIPIPDIKTQRAIADIYKVWVERREINEKLKQQIKDICPVLIRGSLQEAARA